MLLCSGLTGVGVAGEHAVPYAPDGARTAVGSAPQTSVETAAAADPVFRLRTVGLASRPGLRFARGVVVVSLDEGLEARPGGGFRIAKGSGLDSVLASRGILRAERLFPWDCEDRTGGECGFLRLTFPEETNLQELMEALAAVEGVARVEPVGVHSVNFRPDDPYSGWQWALNHVPDHDVNAPEAWDVERGDSSVVVAVVDTGVDWQHPDLGGEAPYTGGNVWTNWEEMNGAAGVDDDANGFVDDVRGWDFVTGEGGSACAGEDAETTDNDPADYYGHGTHVAGIAAAVTDNATGVASLAHDCKVMPVRAGWCALGYGGVVRMDFCAQGIMYAARNGARVINCSWNSDASGGLDLAADTAVARGAIIVVSAGNQANQSQAANYLSTRGDCFDVAATDSNDVKYEGSSYGTWVDFSAPGEAVLSTYYNRMEGNPQARHWYAFMDGTSMAAPHVSGLAALLLSQDPARTWAAVRNAIVSTCDPIGELNPSYAGLLGAGRINAYKALSLGSGNWQKSTDGPVAGSPLPVTVGLQEWAVVTSSDGCVYVLSSGGGQAAGWPKCLPGSLTSPAAGHLDGDGSVEIVAASDSGYVCVWEANGSTSLGWPVKLGAGVVSGPVLCDLDEDGRLEIVCGTADASVHVLEPDGSESTTPVDLSGFVTSDPAFVTVGLDSSSVMMMGTSDSRLEAFEASGVRPAGWPVTLGTCLVRSPAAADVDADGRGEVFVGDADGYLYGVDDLGGLLDGWPRSSSAAVTRSLALGDVDGDSIPDVVAACSDGAVYVWSVGGELIAGWPAHAGGTVSSSPAVVDVDADGKCEIAVGCDDGDMYVWTSQGVPLAGWPRSTGAEIRSSPCLHDFDGDGEFELVVGSDDGKVHFWNLDGSSAPDQVAGWPMYRHDAYRTGNSGLTFVTPPRPVKPHLAVVASPNPFGGDAAAVTFNISIPGSSGASSGRRGAVLIFDVAGRVVAEIPVFGAGSQLSVTWDGGNGSSRKLGAGVYAYTAEIDGLKAEGKLVFLKR
ncbi:MAG: S8 family serine peptidase [Candidatus Eisenbacteria bacterium]|nr:S8 family serine peptidase [Candidatus Eisenbacteria bacterium]